MKVFSIKLSLECLAESTASEILDRGVGKRRKLERRRNIELFFLPTPLFLSKNRKPVKTFANDVCGGGYCTLPCSVAKVIH